MPIKFTRPLLTFILLTLTLFSYAQSVLVQSGTKLPADTTVRNRLLSSLNGFIDQVEQPNRQNKFVTKADLLETSALLDEMKGLEQNATTKDDHFYKCYLTNVTKLDDYNFIIQLSYMGISDNKPVLRASVSLIGVYGDDSFYFCSPLKQNTRYWKTKKLDNITFYSKDIVNNAEAASYKEKVELYDTKLGVSFLPMQFYFCDNFTEAQKLLGIDYKADYNGTRFDVFTSHENSMGLTVSGWSSNQYRFDPHDLWHDRLRTVMSGDIINRPVDEGVAYLYGGSWGYTWTEVLTKFKKYAADHPDADWLTLYTESKNFEDGEKPLKIPYVLNALIVQKIDYERGFPSVMKLLGCGKRQAGDDNYFTVLETVAGINKFNFNASIQNLINSNK